MRLRPLLLAAGVLVVLGLPAAASAAPPAAPPPPHVAGGKPLAVLAGGVPTPTAFGFLGRDVFAGSGPDEQGDRPTGLFHVAGGRATRVPGSPRWVFGLAATGEELYVSTGPAILALGGWDGRRFASRRTVVAPAAPFNGFNGLAFGPDGRLYAGISLGPKNDHGPDPTPFAFSVVAVDPAGGDLQTVATGLRQPFQMAFAGDDPAPFVTDLAQDKGLVPGDAIVHAQPGDDFGFPGCNPRRPDSCEGFAEPLVTLPRHASPMGIVAVGQTLYVGLFGGLRGKPMVVRLSTDGGRLTPVITGFAAPVIAVGERGGRLYIGDLTGRLYRARIGALPGSGPSGG
jgi:glucose/arabinose dehydrogenase